MFVFCLLSSLAIRQNIYFCCRCHVRRLIRQNLHAVIWVGIFAALMKFPSKLNFFIIPFFVKLFLIVFLVCHNSHDGLMNDSGKDVAILSQELNGNDKIPVG